MKLVTLAEVRLNRIGSLRFAQPPHEQATRFVEVRDSNVEALREAVVALAVELGEGSDALARIQVDRRAFDRRPAGAVAFELHQPHIQYSQPYAECMAFPALKIDDRYFKLDEIGL